MRPPVIAVVSLFLDTDVKQGRLSVPCAPTRDKNNMKRTGPRLRSKRSVEGLLAWMLIRPRLPAGLESCCAPRAQARDPESSWRTRFGKVGLGEKGSVHEGASHVTNLLTHT